jgi:hypothetical protein
MCSDAPDTRIAQEAALKNAEISKEALEWYKQVYSDGAPDRNAASQLARQQSQKQIALSDLAIQTATEANDRYKTKFAPVEDRIVADAMAYDTTARRESEAREAVADTQIALTGQQQATTRSLERRGVSLGSGKAMALQGQFDLGAARLKAGAANSARERVETIGAAKMMDAAGIGRGVVGNQATQAQIGLNASNSGVASAATPITLANQSAALMGQGYNTALQGNTSSANIGMGIANAQAGVDAANGQTAAAGAAAVGTIAVVI